MDREAKRAAFIAAAVAQVRQTSDTGHGPVVAERAAAQAAAEWDAANPAPAEAAKKGKRK